MAERVVLKEGPVLCGLLARIITLLSFIHCFLVSRRGTTNLSQGRASVTIRFLCAPTSKHAECHAIKYGRKDRQARLLMRDMVCSLLQKFGTDENGLERVPKNRTCYKLVSGRLDDDCLFSKGAQPLLVYQGRMASVYYYKFKDQITTSFIPLYNIIHVLASSVR